MEVNEEQMEQDVDGGLLRAFSCMGTTDKEVLVAQLKKLIGGHVSDYTANFFLDMTNWNLNAAVGAYYDLESPSNLPSMAFVGDTTVGEGESVTPNTRFIKKLCIRNSGTDKWPIGCHLRYTSGCMFTTQDRVLVEPLLPGDTTDVVLEMSSPSTDGLYQAVWRMSTATGSFFGESIWVIVTVSGSGTLALTQQLNQMNELGSPPRISDCNPFARNSISKRTDEEHNC